MNWVWLKKLTASFWGDLSARNLAAKTWLSPNYVRWCHPKGIFLEHLHALKSRLVNNSVMKKCRNVAICGEAILPQSWFNQTWGCCKGNELCRLNDWTANFHDVKQYTFVSSSLSLEVVFIIVSHSTRHSKEMRLPHSETYHTPGDSMRPFNPSVRGYLNFLKRWLDLKKVTGNWQVRGDSRCDPFLSPIWRSLSILSLWQCHLTIPTTKVTKTCQAS